MKKNILIFISFLFFNSYGQSKDSVYFFINPKDTLIKKQIANKTNNFEGYKIINEKREVKKTKRSSAIDGDDIEYTSFESFSFSFNRENDTIISKSYVNNLNIIRERKQFLDVIKKLRNERLNFIFIEPKSCNRFIMRSVEILTFE
ncbi:hypothetical protein [Pseudotamlana carrageenivorans]|uniref:Uncharacterized protein n=1 Tax=Pseudotamlana carrageenivorans TaxID=2069432 RepID=A0A2I7SFZ5_9FLAO|nr:hypothetical protein [Tamlana carrageenivorans]AUS04774.1 hypothetical protein C1A40_04470 [Tamlana carrageenivorans]